MFKINSEFRIKSSIPVITDNYSVLHFDEYPILFSGTNKFGNKLLGSLAGEGDDDIFRNFIIVLDDKQYSKFFNSIISYRDLIIECQELFVIDKDINENIVSTYQVPLTNIPVDFLPLKQSFIPKLKAASTSLSFGFSLKGKLADLHKAFVYDINSVSQRIYDYLSESIDVLGKLAPEAKIYSQPSSIGSYRLNFDIELKKDEQYNLFPIDENKIASFINTYNNYIAYQLPKENNNLLEEFAGNSSSLLELQQSLLDVYKEANLEPGRAISDLLIDSINSSANKLIDVTEYLIASESFNAIELGNYNKNGDFIVNGYLDKEYKDQTTSKLLPELTSNYIENVVSDETPQSYRILVFRLNRDNGKGGARLYYNEEFFDTVRLNIDKGSKKLSNSIFTKSLDEDKVVDVKGIATKVNGVYKKLDCYLE